MAVAAAKRKKRTGLELEMDENDKPIVPDPSYMKGSDRETFIRHFVTHYYSEWGTYCFRQLTTDIWLIGEASGSKKAKVPWAHLSSEHCLFIDSEYLPVDVELTDPSKIHRDVTESIMQHWWNRQEDSTEDVTFSFIAFEQKDSTGGMMMVQARPSSDRRMASSNGRTQSKGKNKGKGKEKSKTKQRGGTINSGDDLSMEELIAEELKGLEDESRSYSGDNPAVS